MTPSAKRRVFISYARADGTFAHRLAKDLRALGFPVWLDVWEMQVGGSLVGGIEAAIDKSSWMVVVLSPSALKSDWVLRELRSGLVKEAQEHRVFVLPVLYRSVELPAFLRDKFYADCRESYEPGFTLIRDRLVEEYRNEADASWLVVRRPESYLPETFYSAFCTDVRAMLSALPDAALRVDPNAHVVFLNRSKRPPHLTRHPGPLDDEANKSRGGCCPHLDGLWFGRSGRLIIRQNGMDIAGDYDWHGVSLAGTVRGRIAENGIVHFGWDWRLSTEKGNGIFWSCVPNVLYGGWWMDYEDFDAVAFIEKRRSIPNPWEFVRVNGLNISPAPSGQ